MGNDKLRLHIPPEECNFNHNYQRLTEIVQNNGVCPNGLGLPKTIDQATGSVKERIIFNSEDGKVHISIDGRGAKIELNPNKMCGYKPDTSDLTSYEQIVSSVDETYERLLQAGFVLPDLKKYGSVYSYDNSFDLLPENPFKEYKPIFKTAGAMQTTNPKARRKSDIKGTLYFSTASGNSVITVYDKQRESGLDYPCARIECRHTHVKKVPFGKLSAKDYETARSKDKAQIAKMFFRSENPYFTSELEKVVLEYVYYQTLKGKFGANEQKGLCNLVLAYCPSALELLNAARGGFSESNKRQARRILNEIKLYIGFESVEMQNRYFELLNLFKVAA